MELNIKEFKKQFDNIVEQNNRLDYIKGRYSEFSERLMDIGKNILAIAKEIDPVKEQQKKYLGYTNYTYVIEELYKKMTEGTHITSKLILKTYPEMNKRAPNYILKRLQNMPNVNKEKEGNTIRLFI